MKPFERPSRRVTFGVGIIAFVAMMVLAHRTNSNRH
jgi:hypothetical protein